jgi:hypothetical protein
LTQAVEIKTLNLERLPIMGLINIGNGSASYGYEGAP